MGRSPVTEGRSGWMRRRLIHRSTIDSKGWRSPERGPVCGECASRSNRPCAETDGTPEPSEQKNFCSAGVCPVKGKTSHNEFIMRCLPGAGSDVVRPAFAGASRRAWRSGRWAVSNGWKIQSRLQPLHSGEVDSSSMLNVQT